MKSTGSRRVLDRAHRRQQPLVRDGPAAVEREMPACEVPVRIDDPAVVVRAAEDYVAIGSTNSDRLLILRQPQTVAIENVCLVRPARACLLNRLAARRADLEPVWLLVRRRESRSDGSESGVRMRRDVLGHDRCRKLRERDLRQQAFACGPGRRWQCDRSECDRNEPEAPPAARSGLVHTYLPCLCRTALSNLFRPASGRSRRTGRAPVGPSRASTSRRWSRTPPVNGSRGRRRRLR